MIFPVPKVKVGVISRVSYQQSKGAFFKFYPVFCLFFLKTKRMNKSFLADGHRNDLVGSIPKFLDAVIDKRHILLPVNIGYPAFPLLAFMQYFNYVTFF